MGLFYLLDYWLEVPCVLSGDKNDLGNIVDCQELERVEHNRDVGQGKQTLGSVTAKRLEPVVKRLSEEHCLQVSKFFLYTMHTQGLLRDLMNSLGCYICFLPFQLIPWFVSSVW